MNPAAHHRYFPFLQPAGVARQAKMAAQAAMARQVVPGITLRQLTIALGVAVAAREGQVMPAVQMFLAARAVTVL